MATMHIESKKEDIAKVVLMPGDPLRAKYIAEKFLSDYKLVNTVRNMFAYTGYYQGKKITVFASGMGCASIGIYAYELFQFYEVETIIRIGTCGTMNEKVRLLDIIIASSAYSLNPFALLFEGNHKKEFSASKDLNEKLIKKAQEKKMKIQIGKIITSDIFDPYIDAKQFLSCFPSDDYIASEMEAFALFYLAQKLNRKASCLLTVVDSKYQKESLTSEQREKSLDEMIVLALDTLI